MDEQQRYLLKAYKKAIGDDLRPEDIFSYLQSKFVLDVDDVELIKSEKTSRRRTEKMLSILPEKGNTAFIHLYNGLMDAGYDHLSDLLTSGIKDEHGISRENSRDYDTPSVETILREGGVPRRPTYHTKRPQQSLKLKEALFSLKEKDGWVLLHGMAGSGKTVLAAEVLEDAKLLHECFPGGIFWVSLGVVDASKLLMKMQNLSAWLDPDRTHPVPRNLEEARDRIRILFAQEHPRSLLILDDLWTKEDARHFEVRARTLVTSRNNSVTDNITSSVTKVHLDEGFTETQSQSILSKWTGVSSGSLPPQAKKIIEQCKGSPLAISMIGALLQRHPNRWNYYLDQLLSSKVSKVKTNLAYEYSTLFDAIAISVNNLPEDIKEKYMYFAIFHEDSKIPGNVLGLLWDEDEIEVEDTMDELISRSLAKQHSASTETPYATYSVHDLQLDYLKESQTGKSGDNSLSHMHKTLIEKYSAHCDGNFSSLANDGYVYWYLIDHLIQAKMVNKAVELLLDFAWIDAKLRATGAPDLINSYHQVEKLAEDEVVKKLSDFKRFISVNSYLLSTPGKQECDLVQLALAQPYLNLVHKEAKTLVQQCCNQNKFFVGWCNKPDEASEKCLLTVKHHSSAVYCCDFAKDKSDRIVSCGGDSIVKVWDGCTGKSLHSMEGHTDIVYCCQFSPDCRSVVSASADKSVKLWNAENGKPILTLKGHTDDVYCCRFSPNGKVIATCSADNSIKIWDSTTGYLLENLTGHEEAVNWCCFSPDGQRIASASNDTTLKVWDLRKGECLFTTCGDKDFLSYCVYHPSGERILVSSQNFLQFVNAKDGASLRTIQTSCSVLAVDFSPDGKYAVGAHADSTAQLWNIDAEACMGIFRGHSGWLHFVSFSGDGLKIVTASADETCKIWKVEPIADRAIKLRKVFDVSFVAVDGPLLVAANTNHEIQVFNGRNGEFLRRSLSLGSRISFCKFNGDGSLIIVGFQTGHLKVLETRTCEELFTFVGHYGSIKSCSLCKDGTTIVTGSEDSTIKVWDLEQRIIKTECKGHSASVTRCVVFQDDTRILSSSFDGSIKVWDIFNGQCLFTCNHNDNNALLSCAVSSNNKLLVSTSAGSSAKLWNAENGELLHTLDNHSDCVRCATFSMDCRMLATGSDDGTVKLWDTSTGEEIATCERHNVWVTDVKFSPDGKRVLSVSNDIKWWNTDGSLLQTFYIKGNFLRHIIVSRDFDKFITIDDSGQLYILNAI